MGIKKGCPGNKMECRGICALRTITNFREITKILDEALPEEAVTLVSTGPEGLCADIEPVFAPLKGRSSMLPRGPYIRLLQVLYSRLLRGGCTLGLYARRCGVGYGQISERHHM